VLTELGVIGSVRPAVNRCSMGVKPKTMAGSSIA
jgi:hypothetical protein